ncbi:MAG: t4-like baseplate wedge, partial [Polyangiaceae bacterium]|nr:t4-like baseplate wedge [Polyangiaceae bacterium]
MLLPRSTDYTDLDFDAIRSRLFLLIATVFPTWTEEKKANFGNMLVELFAWVGDILNFNQDNQSAEAFVPSASQRNSLLALAERSGYVPAGAAAAQVTATLSIPAALAGDVVIPDGAIALTAEITDPIRFQLLGGATILAGQTSVTGVTFEHSEPHEDVFTSDGTPAQTDALRSTPYLDGSATVVAANGTFTQVDNFYESGPTDRHFIVQVDQFDRAKLTYGDGVIGMIPTGSRVVSYKTGGGPAGEIEPNALKRFEEAYADTLGVPVKITIEHPASTGATPRTSNAEMRQQIPRDQRVLTRCCSREDYEIAAEQVPGVARALHLTSNQDLYLGENRGIVFLVPTQGGWPSQELIDAVKAMIEPEGDLPGMNAYQLTYQGALYLVVDVHAVVGRKAGVSKPAARAAIERALSDWFAILVANQ